MIFGLVGEGPCKTYLLASQGQAVLIDPLLERVELYLDLLKRKGLRLVFVLDTHTHADHLSACAALQDSTNAPYLMHKNAKASCVARKVEDGEVLGVGEARLKFLHTPGHTQDSLTVVLEDRILSGDFLFIGDQAAGRLDLPGSDPRVHYESLKKFDPLPDGLLLYPAHDYRGNSHSSLGQQRKLNPVFSPRTRDAYVQWWLDKKFGPADWMTDVIKANVACTRDPHAVQIPKEGAACACSSFSADADLPQITAVDLARKLERAPTGLFLLDVRTQEEYVGELGHIAGSVLIPVDELPGRVREVPTGASVISICRSGKRAAKAAQILKGAGCDKVWVLTGGMLAWNAAKLPVA